MPYWRHVKETEPKSGTAYPSMAEARQSLMPKTELVTFVATPDEIDDWRARERHRYITGRYLVVPWIADHDLTWRYSGFPDAVRHHYPHRSQKHPDLIAYTKNDEHGVNDRQTAVKPGRYLEEFYKDVFTSTEIADYIARCKASTQELKIARSTEDIVTIYSKTDCGFTSCMQHKRDPEYAWQRRVENGERPHPCAVYGESDLGVAYLGELDGRIMARAVVWPDRKQYARVYGDGTLTAILNTHGYTMTGIEGARVRYVTHVGQIVMPYVDGIDSASIVKSGSSTPEWIVLDDDGRISCNNVTGYGDSAEDSDYELDDDQGDDLECAHCHESYCYGDQGNGALNRTWCDECLDARERCALCGGHGWDYDDIGGHIVCQGCVDNYSVTCTAEHTVTFEDADSLYDAGFVRPCDNFWIEALEFTSSERADREARRVHTRCRTCAEGVQSCAQCAAVFDDDQPACAVCGHAVRCPHTLDLPLEAAEFVSASAIGPSPIDGSIWWQETPDVNGRTINTGYWVKFSHRAGGWYCERDEACELTDLCHVGRASNFETLDDSDAFHRCIDPRLAGLTCASSLRVANVALNLFVPLTDEAPF